ncbi:hypothetical protein [Microbispora sp. CA-102843]|uniref:hypothetical protein n=1 Tax=Microbispora sp. CA-102843 TaxID=3239952 RepID=UPI003D8F3979
MADPVTDPVAEHDARYGEEGAGPPDGELGERRGDPQRGIQARATDIGVASAGRPRP